MARAHGDQRVRRIVSVALGGRVRNDGPMMRMLGIAAMPDALAARASGWDRLLTLGLLAACGLLAAGLTLPIIQTSRWLFLSDQMSLLRLVRELWVEREIFLSIVVAVFSVVFPVIKLIVAYGLWRMTAATSARFGRLLSLVDFLGKWSLADVLIVALAIVVIKSSGFASATVGLGVYPFTAAIVLTAAIVARLKQLAKRAAEA
jgi:paraquat-inducible protein A